MDEKELEHRLCDGLRSGVASSAALASLAFTNSTSDAKTVADLTGTMPYEVIQDHSEWNPFPQFMVDVIGGMTPDVVLRSSVSGENRIYIEVKKTGPLGYGRADSQVVRYFMHLLATTRRKPASALADIRRAVVLAAPFWWFTNAKNGDVWRFFLETYSPLAGAFDVTLAELHLPEQ